MIEYPKLRPVEAIATEQGTICLRDPLGFSDQLVFLPREALFVVSLFDGRHTVVDVQHEFAQRFGTILPGEKVREMVEQLDACLFLDSERFRQARDLTIETFREARVRPASHAGVSYQADPASLRRQLQELFEAAAASAGAGTPAGRAEAATPAPPRLGRLRGLIAPHIDVQRGGRCYAAAYRELQRSSAADTFVVLGIAHGPMRRRFALCGKDFATPLGDLAVDRELSGSLGRRLRTDFYADEFAHRSEHSVEFQAVFLRYLYGEQKPVRFLPILCGGFEKAKVSGLPEDEAEVREFFDALTEALDERGGSACCIAGVDLSHLGRRFGQDMTMDPAVLEQAEADDRRMIERILAGDAEGFFRIVQEEGDRRNVCGVPAIYTLLRLLEAAAPEEGARNGYAVSGRLLGYERAVEEPTQSVVTFMSAGFYA